ncbi:hypothetical protein NIES2101_40600 [Calothrix sp. HK-06]|nr:hypothetical protein NIES2101_40600 [Calothrix sp. HK-06]
MKIYQGYNLYIASELEMPELIEAEGKPDVTIRFGSVDDKTIKQSNNSDCVTGEMPDIGKFCLKQGYEIIVEPLPEVDEGILRTVLLGPILCILLRQRGLLVLHASAVNIKGKAIAFIGSSGWGKSTLATAFHTGGYDVLCDDVMPVQISTRQPLVFPAYPQFKVWKDAATSLGHNIENLSPIFKDAPKLSYRFSHGFQQTPLPLHQIYVLDKGDEHEIIPINAQEAFVNLVRHSRTIDLPLHQDFVMKHLKLSTELIKQVNFRRFIRKPALEDLPELVQMIVNDVVKVTVNK